MEHHRHPVAGGLHIGLDMAVAQTRRPRESVHRVLFGLERAAAMREGDGLGVGEEGMRAHVRCSLTGTVWPSRSTCAMKGFLASSSRTAA